MFQLRCRSAWGSFVLSLALIPVSLASGQTIPDTLDVLFVGNSYTYFNNLPRLVEAISLSLDGPVVRTGIEAAGGQSLAGHMREGKIPLILQEGGPTGDPWDRVLLQEQSRLGVGYADPDRGELGSPVPFQDAVRSLATIIRESGAVPMLYMTWAKESFPDQTGALANAYDGIGTELGIPVAPVGLAWARVRRDRPGLGLFAEDGSHPNEAGSYLAACVIYAELAGQSPGGAPRAIVGMPWDGGGVLSGKPVTTLVSIPSDVSAYLQRVAWETVASR